MPGFKPLIERMCADHNKANRCALTPKEFVELYSTGQVASTARLLGVSRSCLLDAIAKHGVDLKSGPNAHSPDAVTYNGITGSIRYLSLQLGIRPGTVRTRISRGWTPEEALSGKRIGSTMPPRPGIFEYNGHFGRITDLARIAGISPDVVFKRIRRGWPLDVALSSPALKKRRGEELAAQIEYQGVKATIAEHAKRIGLSARLARGRWLNGWPLEVVFSLHDK